MPLFLREPRYQQQQTTASNVHQRQINDQRVPESMCVRRRREVKEKQAQIWTGGRWNEALWSVEIIWRFEARGELNNPLTLTKYLERVVDLSRTAAAALSTQQFRHDVFPSAAAFRHGALRLGGINHHKTCDVRKSISILTFFSIKGEQFHTSSKGSA